MQLKHKAKQISLHLERFISASLVDSLYVLWKECYRLELETTSLASSRHWDLQLMLLTRIVLTTIPPSLLLTIAVPPINLMRSHQVIARTAKQSWKTEHSFDWPKPGKTAKIHTQSQSLKAGSLMIQKLKMKRGPNIISNIPACLIHHIVLLTQECWIGGGCTPLSS